MLRQVVVRSRPRLMRRVRVEEEGGSCSPARMKVPPEKQATVGGVSMGGLGGGEGGRTVLRDKVQRRGVLPHGEVRQLRVAGGVREQVRERRLGGGQEPVHVPPEARGRVHVHLDEVLVETIAASAPAAGGSDKEAGGNVDVAAEQPGERLPDGGRGLRREEVGFSALREARVLGVAGDVAEAGPLEDEGAGGGEAVGGGVCGARGVEAEDVVGDAGGGVEGDLEVVGEADGLLEDGLDGGGGVTGGCLRFEGAREEVVGWGGGR